MKTRQRNLVIDETEYSNDEIQFIQKALDKKSKQIFVFKDLIRGESCLCAIASIQLSYNEVLCAVGDAYVQDESFSGGEFEE